MMTPYHAKYFAYDLTKRCSSDNVEKLAGAVASAQVDLNPHQIDAALFAFRSPLSTGAILADEVGLGKTIEAGLVISQRWAERKRRILVITPSNLRKQWYQELAEKFFLPCRLLETKSYNAAIRQGNFRPFEMKDHIVVVEAPLFEERSAAVIKALEQKIPGKPIKYVVMTHFHIDHSGGIRAYAAKGATVLGHDANVQFLNTMLSRPKTVRPDSLARAGNSKFNIEAIKDAKSLTDGERTIELRAIENPHAKGMLAAYLPKEKLLFVSDLFTPGTPVDPANEIGVANAAALYKAIIDQKLEVERIVGGHGEVAPLRDLMKAGAAKLGS